MGTRKPSTRTVERSCLAATRSALSVRTVVMTGARRPISRDTVGCEQPNSSATKAWDRLCRRGRCGGGVEGNELLGVEAAGKQAEPLQQGDAPAHLGRVEAAGLGADVGP